MPNRKSGSTSPRAATTRGSAGGPDCRPDQNCNGVTGTNIKKIESEGALPVQVVTRQDIEQQGIQTAVSIGATILGAFLGRKTLSTANIGRAPMLPVLPLSECAVRWTSA